MWCQADSANSVCHSGVAPYSVIRPPLEFHHPYEFDHPTPHQISTISSEVFQI